jgi:hypothetical protein
MVELHPYPWEIKPDRERLFREARDRNLLCIYFGIYDQYLAYAGKQRWCCKSTFMIEHVAAILRYHPEARFIFMVRDGRDVAVSAKHSIFNHFHVYYSALRWQREQRLGLDLLARLPGEQIMLLKYEELIAEPEQNTRELCAFLGEPFDEHMLVYHLSGEAKKSGSLSISWENTSKPVLKGNAEKFRSQLNEREIFMFEAIAWRELQELDYKLTLSPELLLQKSDEAVVERLSYRLVENLLKLRAEARHLLRDRNSLIRWRKNFFMICLRISRRWKSPHA